MKKRKGIIKLCIGLALALPVISKASVKGKPKIYHVCTESNIGEIALACAMYAESRGEGVWGQWATGNVVLNRKNAPMYPSRIRKVLYQKGQFSYTKNKRLEVYDKGSWEQSRILARHLILFDRSAILPRSKVDITRGSLFFYRKDKEPLWMRKYYTKRLTYKRHVFYG